MVSSNRCQGAFLYFWGELGALALANDRYDYCLLIAKRAS